MAKEVLPPPHSREGEKRKYGLSADGEGNQLRLFFTRSRRNFSLHDRSSRNAVTYRVISHPRNLSDLRCESNCFAPPLRTRRSLFLSLSIAPFSLLLQYCSFFLVVEIESRAIHQLSKLNARGQHFEKLSARLFVRTFVRNKIVSSKKIRCLSDRERKI